MTLARLGVFGRPLLALGAALGAVAVTLVLRFAWVYLYWRAEHKAYTRGPDDFGGTPTFGQFLEAFGKSTGYETLGAFIAALAALVAGAYLRHRRPEPRLRLFLGVVIGVLVPAGLLGAWVYVEQTGDWLPVPPGASTFDYVLAYWPSVLSLALLPVAAGALVLWRGQDGPAPAEEPEPGPAGELVEEPPADEGHGHGPVEILEL
ncbi:hypothetical protein AB0M28_00290 [Streptomyces sp. NPDC051940]|uniref:hypothetical protein n=1 Tax=Streptomyces sp. NPDC051940 TaxID=3155675 RepID=UPI0034297CFA